MCVICKYIIYTYDIYIYTYTYTYIYTCDIGVLPLKFHCVFGILPLIYMGITKFT